MVSTGKLIIVPVIFYVLLAIVFGFLGESGLSGSNDGSTSGDYDISEDISDNIDINSSSDIGVTDLPGFLDGVIFTVSGLPWWLNSILVLPVISMILGIIFLIRGI